MSGRQLIPSFFSLLRARARLRWGLAGVCTLVAVTGLLPSAAAFARGGAAASGAHLRARASSCPWLNQSLTPGARANMLLSHMSLAEKIAEMYVNSSTTTGPYAGYEGWVASQPALCIPSLVEQDGSLGVGAGATGVTQLPDEVSLASAWDPSLAYQYGVVNGQEHRAKGIAMVLGPGVNIQRDPRWGRNFEMFSEDPFLTSTLGTADVEGIQSQGVMADVKHFATYNAETDRITPPYQNTIVSTRVLNEIYLPPFYSAVEQAHAASIMCAYPLLNGAFSCQNPGLLTGILDDQWAFPGFVRSDGAANVSTVESADAGLDQERGSYFWDNGLLQTAVTDGQVSTVTINQALRRILTQMFQFGLFNNPPTGNLSSPATTPADNAFAQNVAARGTVLLQNLGNILPLSTATTKSIAVIGADGSTSPDTAGNGSAYVNATSVISPLSGITARAGSAATVTSYSGSDPAQAAAAAKAAQVAIVFANQPESEGADLKNISLPNGQDELIESVAAANPNTIVVLNTGGPVLMPWLPSVKGVLEAWYPGQDDGAAIASVLFGDTDPSGHLPQTFPSSLVETPTQSASQFPGVNGQVHYSEGLDVGYRWYDAHNVAPLFPFGYGLSYTKFRFSNLTVTPRSVVNSTSGPGTATGQAAQVARVTATITNTGPVAGSDVAQLYVGDPATAGEPPRQLEGFARVTLAPGASRTVSFKLTGRELSYFSTTANGWTLPAGQFSIYVGDSSALTSLPLHGKLTITRTVGNRYAGMAAPAAVDPAGTFTAKATFVNHGNLAIKNGIVRLGYPSTWTVVRLARSRTLSVPAGRSATVGYRVTPPEQAAGLIKNLTAQLSSAGRAGAGNLSATAQVTVREPVTLRMSSPVVVSPSFSTPTTVSVVSHINQALRVKLTPSLPAGVTVAPASPTVFLPAHKTVSVRVLVSAAAGQAAATEHIGLTPKFSYVVRRVPMTRTQLAAAKAQMTVDIPYPSLAAAFDASVISDDSAITAANFDGNGNSYSEQALTAVGLAPGANVPVDGTTVQWPNVAAGTPDSVIANGQTVSLTGSPADTQLVVLGASSGADEKGTGLIEYNDGTVQPFTMTLDNWFNPADTGSNKLVAVASYVNDSTGAGNKGVVGKRNHKARVFAVAIPLRAGKTVASVTLPEMATLPGVFPTRIFALGLSGAPAT